MENWIHTFVIIHIIGGTISLISGIFPMFVTKGNDAHRWFGRVFFFGMCIVFVTGLTVSIYKRLDFLLLISIFSFYLVCSGYRSLYLKKLHGGQRPKVIDWVLNIVSGIFMLGMLAFGVYLLIANGNPMGVVSIVFGLIGLRSVYSSLHNFVKAPKSKTIWIVGHITGMVAGYIAAFTAFIVVNNDKHIHLPGYAAWLLPTALGTPFIFYWIKKYKKPVKSEYIKGRS